LAYSYEQILQAQFEVAQAENASANAALEDARLREDPHDVQAAVDRLVANNNVVQQLNQAAAQMQRQQQAPQVDAAYAGLKPHQQQLAAKLGLTGAEAEHALVSTSDPRIDDATRMQDYARGKQKREAWRATGAWDEIDVQKGYRR
jgi:hypothetical protein